MDLSSLLSVSLTALELGLITSLTVLALFVSYSMLNVCDLSTDGCFTLGAVVGAIVAINGHPFLAIFAALLAGSISGFITAFLQTKMGVDSLLAGIVVNTGLYSINIALMGNASLLNMNKTTTIMTLAKNLLADSFLSDYYKLVVIILIVIIVIIFLSLFLTTRLGLAIRATGNNVTMVKSSSIDPTKITIITLCLANSLTALAGCLLAYDLKSTNIDIGSGILTIALASLLIGRSFFKNGKIYQQAIGAVIGSFIFRFVYTLALRLDMKASMLKLVSSIIVIIAISVPYLKKQAPLVLKRMKARKREVC